MSVSAKRGSVSIATSTVSASAVFPSDGQSLQYFKVVNASASICYVNTGSGSATATNANVAVAPNASQIFQKGNSSTTSTGLDDTVALLLGAGTGLASVFSVAVAND